MFLKAATFVVSFATLLKVFSTFLSQPGFLTFGWLAFGSWIIWILYALEHDKDIPGVGPFNYQGGKNQPARIFFAVTTVGVFIVAVIFG
jgi:hypothetical protein